MDKKTLRKRELLTKVLKNHGFYEGENVRMTKREMLKLLRKSFDSNSKVYDRYQESWAIDSAVNTSWDIYIAGYSSDEEYYAEFTKRLEDEAKRDLKKDWYFLIKWCIFAGYFSGEEELVRYLYSVHCNDIRDDFWGRASYKYDSFEKFVLYYAKMTRFVFKMLGVRAWNRK